MNTERRRSLDIIMAALGELTETLQDLKSDTECLLDEEQDAYGNMPESLQGSERGEKMEAWIDALESLMSSLDNAASDLDDACSEIDDLLNS